MEKKNISRTYLAIDADSKIIGYYSIGLRCLKVPMKDDENGNELKDDRFTIRMNVYPKTRVAQSYLIGQLSRSWDSPKGFGSKLMENAIHHTVDANRIVGCRLIRVDCDDELINYYSRCGFKLVNKDNDGKLNQMIYILRTDQHECAIEGEYHLPDHVYRESSLLVG